MIRTLLALLALTGAAPMDTPPPPLAAMRWHDRVLLVFADSDRDPSLAAQREISRDRGFADRDLRLVAVTADRVTGAADSAAALRHRYGIAHGFHALLIGKDGHVADRATTPFDARALFATIDAMPMRQDEMRRR